MAKFILQGLLIVAGAISMSSALFDWDWFFGTSNAQQSIKVLGSRRRARLFYAIGGVIMIIVAVFLVK